MLRFARSLQVFGVLLIPAAFILVMTRREMNAALAMFALGGALFLTGRLLERRIP